MERQNLLKKYLQEKFEGIIEKHRFAQLFTEYNRIKTHIQHQPDSIEVPSQNTEDENDLLKIAMLEKLLQSEDESAYQILTCKQMLDTLLDLNIQGEQLNQAQFEEYLTSMNIFLTRTEKSQLFNQLDVDCSGNIDREELIQLVDDTLRLRQQQKMLKIIFQLIDINGFGSISQLELQQFQKDLGFIDITKEEVRSMFAAMKVEGSINLRQFLSTFTLL